MKIVELNCNQCGAALEVGIRSQFVTCAFCQSKLRIHHTSTSHFSEVLEEIEKKTDRLVDEVAELKHRSKVEEIDRGWAMDRESYMVESKHGHKSVPTATEAMIGLVVVPTFGIFWTVGAISIGSGFFFPLFGVVFIGLGIHQGVSNLKKARAFEVAKANYIERRRQAGG